MSTASLRRRVDALGARLDPETARRESMDVLVSWLSGGPHNEAERALFARVLARPDTGRMHSNLRSWLSEEAADTAKETTEGSNP